MPGKLHLISKDGVSINHGDDRWKHALGEVDRFHLRQKNLSPEQVYQWGKQLLEKRMVTEEKLVINSWWQVADKLGCVGVHLPENAPPVDWVRRQVRGTLQIGCSVHSPKKARQREKEGADYLLFGHVYATSSKSGLRPRGLAGLKEVIQSVNIPVLAVGGIYLKEQVREVMNTGCAGVAVISAVADAKDPGAVALQLKKWLKGYPDAHQERRKSVSSFGKAGGYGPKIEEEYKLNQELRQV